MDDECSRDDCTCDCARRSSVHQRRRIGGPVRVNRRVSFVYAAAVTTLALSMGLGPGVLHARADAGGNPTPRPAGRWQDASLDDYRKHLISLQSLTQSCAKARDLKTCDPILVGPDDRVPLDASRSAERRIVRYGWLRILFSHAEEPDKAQQAPDSRAPVIPTKEAVRPAPPTTSQLLVDAQARLAEDLAQANGSAAAPPSHTRQRETMKQVLAGREFRNLHQASESDAILEKLGNWLNKFFANVDKLRTRSAWVGRVLVWGFFLAIAIGLAWALMQMERRWRVRLIPQTYSPAPEAASARDWQLWLADARNAAAAGLWREAIHFVYWASISRLESRRLWPADRARTPREYLALVAPEDPRQPGLASLTGSFERTWYGGREAGEGDYRAAETLASGLISGSGSSAPPVAAEGGAG
jgi:Domain of unknown function (DUF4129)